MTRKLLTTVAAGACCHGLRTSRFLAGRCPKPASPSTPSMSAPADPAAPKPDAMKPAGDAAQAPAPLTAPTPQRPAAAHLTEQASDRVSANTTIGGAVYNGQNEKHR